MSSLKKKKNNGIVLAVILLLLVVGISVGYSALSERLEINGSSNIGANASWNVALDNVKVTVGSATPIKAATISGNTVSYQVDLKTPGDFYEFTVDVINNGTIPAKLNTTPTVPSLTSEQQKYVTYTVAYSDGTTLKANDALTANGGKRTIKVRLEFKKNITELPSTAITLPAMNFVMDYVQQ